VVKGGGAMVEVEFEVEMRLAGVEDGIGEVTRERAYMRLRS